MQCPKCENDIPENSTVCPHCHKVLHLLCPNCGTISDSINCENCGYILLTKCLKCGKMVSTTNDTCKCGFPVKKSISCHECETNEFASVSVKFEAIENIKNILNSEENFKNLFCRLQNLLTAQFSSFEGNIIVYDKTFVINFNKELSLQTSANKAARFALKIANAFTGINEKVLNELSIPLNLKITITKKDAENLLENYTYSKNIKSISTKKTKPKFLSGMQIILDEYIYECIKKEYKTASLFSIEQNRKSIMFYELLIEKYITSLYTESICDISNNEITHKMQALPELKLKPINVFGINAKCKFINTNANDFWNNPPENKIISIRSESSLSIETSDLINYFNTKGKKILRAVCNEETNYKPWGVFEQLFKEYCNFDTLKPKQNHYKKFHSLYNLLLGNFEKASSAEDARFAYMDDFCSFLASLKNCVVIIEGFEYLDDTSIQTLELYFDKFIKINSQFVFFTNKNISLHSKFKGLLRTPFYTEYNLLSTGFDSILGSIKEDAGDFIKSDFYSKIKQNYNGSLLYFKHILRYLTEQNLLTKSDEKLYIENENANIVPDNFENLITARLKNLSTKSSDASTILAYSVYLGFRIESEIMTALGIKNPTEEFEILQQLGFGCVKNNIFYVNNYNLIKPIIENNFSQKVREFLIKSILSTINKNIDMAATAFLMGNLGLFKEEYLILWKNSQFAMKVGDYDAYLKNCLGFLSLVEHINENLEQETIEQNKKEVYENILLNLYSYSPAKIYKIAKVLLNDAIEENNSKLIVKLSNMMLQGALLDSNYTDAPYLLENIFSNMETPELIINRAINTKSLLLSLINIQILFSTGDFEKCISSANEILNIIRPEILDKIKPASFSLDFFKEHLSETFRLAALAKFLLMEDDLNEFFEAIERALNITFIEKDCIFALKSFLSGKHFAPSNIEAQSAFSKVIYLILNEFEEHSRNMQEFAQNIYNAKLLASDIHQKELELFCDLMIAYAYAQNGNREKAGLIYKDVLEKSTTCSIFNIQIVAKYLTAKLEISKGEVENAVNILQDGINDIEKNNKPSKIFEVLLTKLLVDTTSNSNIDDNDIITQTQKLALLLEDNQLSRLN